jgi:lipopolysaccharide export system permease protein
LTDHIPMPLVLYGYILREMAKLLVLSASVLTMVMSVGFMIKPVSEGTLGALALVKLLIFVSPAMLTYALPIAAAFSATLTFFRMSADNEVTACAVSGVSYRSLLVPALGLGLVLTLSMFFLSNWIIPGFWKKVETLAQQDIARIMVDRLNHREPVNFNEFVVYADFAKLISPDEPTPAEGGAIWYQSIELIKPVVAKMDMKTRNVEGYYTGEKARADLYRYQGKVYAMISLTNTAVSADEADVRVSEQSRQIPAQELPSFFKSKPKYLSLVRLREMAANPDLNPTVDRFANDLRHTIAIEDLLDEYQVKLAGEAGSRELDLTGANRENHSLAAPTVERDGDKLWLRSTDQQPVTVLIGPKLASRQTLEAEQARLEVQIARAAEEPRIYLRLDNVKVIDPRLPTPTEQKAVYLPPLRPVNARIGPLLAMNSAALLTHARHSPHEIVHNRAVRLKNEINELKRKIVSTAHERGAMAVCTLLVLMLGAVMSMVLRHQVPLVIFFWCFLPAIAAVFMISGGKNIVRSDAAGLGAFIHGLLIWSGNLFLIAVIWSVYRKLCRH